MFNTMPDKGYNRPTARARELRADMTGAERRLWACLSARKVAGVRFNRQLPIGPFTGDVVSRGAELVIELAGGQLAVSESKDIPRTRYIAAQGYRVLRFWNNDVMSNLEGVVEEIERVLADMPSPDPSRKREGNDVAQPELPSRSREGLPTHENTPAGNTPCP
jgi:very-short-patch-repair endonuclease